MVTISGLHSSIKKIVERRPVSVFLVARLSRRGMIICKLWIQLKRIAKIRAFLVRRRVFHALGAIVEGTGRKEPAVFARSQVLTARFAGHGSANRTITDYRFSAFPAHSYIITHLTKIAQ